MAAKDTLFSELQHRVANNLQLAVSLIRVAQRNLQDPVTAAENLNHAEERLLSMSQLHRRLYGEPAFVNGLEPLLREVLSMVLHDFPVAIHTCVEDVPGLSIDQMTAIVFLVNEAALNAAKHAYSKGLGNRFDVSLTRDMRGRLILSIIDDGPGIDAQASDTRTSSLGIGIMEAFANQLGGQLEIRQGVGASFSVAFIEHHLHTIYNTTRVRHQDRSSGGNT
ncbi:sensor histidine kinase [Methylocystis sp. IM3]|uniref:sensor histidine kinase n=1 Tax=unclassified Methylocystis TaxID=2625913 RepID=UPI0030FAFDDF